MENNVAGWCQTTPGHIWPRRHEAGRGRKVKSAAGGKERNTRVGIVGILAAQPAQLPVICFVVNCDSCRGVEGGLWPTVLLDTSRRLCRPCLQGLECRFCVSVPGLSAYKPAGSNSCIRDVILSHSVFTPHFQFEGTKEVLIHGETATGLTFGSDRGYSQKSNNFLQSWWALPHNNRGQKCRCSLLIRPMVFFWCKT